MLTREQFNDINFGDVYYTVTGPGDFPEKGLCSGEWKVIEKCENKFGRFCRMENLETRRIDVMHSITTIGIGWYKAK